MLITAPPARHGRALTGAWIETSSASHTPGFRKVAPSRARGLKLVQRLRHLDVGLVAPSRARGLKPNTCGQNNFWNPVAPSRARGLKLRKRCRPACAQGGRALTGAWIETWSCGAPLLHGKRRALTGAWIETSHNALLHYVGGGRALTGAWIETPAPNTAACRAGSRALTGAWIETAALLSPGSPAPGSRPHGRVD